MDNGYAWEQEGQMTAKSEMKPRVIWLIEAPTDYIVNADLKVVTGVMFKSKSMAKRYGKPVKFVEVK